MIFFSPGWFHRVQFLNFFFHLVQKYHFHERRRKLKQCLIEKGKKRNFSKVLIKHTLAILNCIMIIINSSNRVFIILDVSQNFCLYLMSANKMPVSFLFLSYFRVFKCFSNESFHSMCGVCCPFGKYLSSSTNDDDQDTWDYYFVLSNTFCSILTNKTKQNQSICSQ